MRKSKARNQLAKRDPRQQVQLASQMHAKRINQDIKALGADRYDMRLPETKGLPLVIYPNERVCGIIYGRYTQNMIEKHLVGRGALIATDQRVLLLDKKPLFVRCDQITYNVISGVTYGRVGFIGTVTLHTRMGDILVRTFNQTLARHFIKAIEDRAVNQEFGEQSTGIESNLPGD